MNRQNAAPERSAQWLSAHLGRPYVDGAQIDQVAVDYASSNPIATVAWLDSIQTFPGKGEPVGYRTTVQTWVAKFGFEQASTWLQNHRQHPAYDRMAIGLATTVKDLHQFNTIVATIRDPNLRTRAMKFAPAQGP